ncbi:MAG TPA: transporter substrate-binding domain-containing protein [Actinomycetota bacterium]|nr:transporter substrate-binding domain-containing protein [Actinomycetota bacterium]
MRRSRSLAFVAAVAVVVTVGVACSKGTTTSAPATGGGMCASVDKTGTDALATICKNGQIRIATDPKYKPASWYNVQTGQWNGFDVQVAQEIAKRLGVTAAIQGEKWDVITAGSWNDRWDLSVGSMTDTVEREKLFYFSPAYYYTPAGVAVYKTNTTITTPADASGKKDCVGVATTYQNYLQKNLVLGAGAPPFKFQIDNAQIDTFTTDTDALDALALGDGVRCDTAISAVPIIQSYIDDGGAIKLIGDPLYYEPLSIAMDKNSPVDQTTLVNAIKTIVTNMHEDGTLSSLSQKWWKTDLTTTNNASS